jgi:hypothetical protein
MANPGYVRSTDGSDSDNGSTFALANATLTGAIADAVAGDRIWVSDNHAESTAGSITLAMPGTIAAPNQVLCGDDAAEPPTSLATTATVSTTGNNGITITGSGYIYGITFTSGSGALGSSAPFNIGGAGNKQMYDACNFVLGTSSITQRISVTGDASAASSELIWKNCGVRFNNASHAITARRGKFQWRGGSALSGGTSPTLILDGGGGSAYQSLCMIEGVDFSNWASGVNIFGGGVGQFVIRNCKLPASWSGSLSNAAMLAGSRYSMYNCDSGDTNYRLWIEDHAGNIKSETTIVRTGGANDGTTAIAWKLATTADAEYPTIRLETDEIARWNETVGSAITVTVEVVTDGVTLTDAECWLEVQYLGTSGFPLSLFASDAKADVIASAANQASSSVTWTTTGLSSPVKQKLSVTFTPQEKGAILAKVILAKASTTVYVCPKLDVT